MDEVLEAYLIGRLEEIGKALIQDVRPQVVWYATEIAKKKDPTNVVVDKNCLDIALTQLGLAIMVETEERMKNAAEPSDIS